MSERHRRMDRYNIFCCTAASTQSEKTEATGGSLFEIVLQRNRRVNKYEKEELLLVNFFNFIKL